jgi:hypothetical protein
MQVAPYASCLVGPPSADGINRIVFTGNTGYGIWVAGGSFQSASNTFTYVNANSSAGIRCDNGYWVSGNSAGATGGVVCSYNATGMKASIIGVIFTALQAQNAVTANVNWDCDAQQSSQISLVHNVNNTGKYTLDGVTRITPFPQVPPVVGPSGGFISVQTP